jgi:hypothetical protein
LESAREPVIKDVTDVLRRHSKGSTDDRGRSIRVLDEAAAAGALRAEPSLTWMRLLQRAVVAVE